MSEIWSSAAVLTQRWSPANNQSETCVTNTWLEILLNYGVYRSARTVSAPGISSYIGCRRVANNIGPLLGFYQPVRKRCIRADIPYVDRMIKTDKVMFFGAFTAVALLDDHQVGKLAWEISFLQTFSLRSQRQPSSHCKPRKFLLKWLYLCRKIYSTQAVTTRALPSWFLK